MLNNLISDSAYLKKQISSVFTVLFCPEDLENILFYTTDYKGEIMARVNNITRK